MTMKSTCPMCLRAAEDLYTAPGGALVCGECLDVVKMVNRHRLMLAQDDPTVEPLELVDCEEDGAGLEG